MRGSKNTRHKVNLEHNNHRVLRWYFLDYSTESIGSKIQQDDTLLLVVLDPRNDVCYAACFHNLTTICYADHPTHLRLRAISPMNHQKSSNTFRLASLFIN